MAIRLERGDRVRDKFKRPKPGDEATQGVVEKVTRVFGEPSMVYLRMDDGTLRPVPHDTFFALFERID